MTGPANRASSSVSTSAKILSLVGGLVLSPVLASAQNDTGPAAAADVFLKTLATKGADASWQIASPQFRAKLSSLRWERYVKASGLDHVRSANWTDLAFKNGVAFLLGTVSLKPGQTVPARFELVKTGASWQILFVDLKLSGAAYRAVRQPGVATDFH